MADCLFKTFILMHLFICNFFEQNHFFWKLNSANEFLFSVHHGQTKRPKRQNIISTKVMLCLLHQNGDFYLNTSTLTMNYQFNQTSRYFNTLKISTDQTGSSWNIWLTICVSWFSMNLTFICFFAFSFGRSGTWLTSYLF